MKNHLPELVFIPEYHPKIKKWSVKVIDHSINHNGRKYHTVLDSKRKKLYFDNYINAQQHGVTEIARKLTWTI